jgi:hypothetical protein
MIDHNRLAVLQATVLIRLSEADAMVPALKVSLIARSFGRRIAHVVGSYVSTDSQCCATPLGHRLRER